MREYTAAIDGVEHTFQLSDEHAARLCDAVKPVVKKQAPAPKNKGA